LWLEKGARGRRIKVYLPSTVAISERPLGMTEYTMAKASAEVLAADLNRSLQNVTIVSSRLPRLPTDQTASILQVPPQSVLEVLLPIVRGMKSAATATAVQ
jgi:hypothetical protein